MSNELARTNGKMSKGELQLELARCENRLASFCSDLNDLDEEAKAIREEINTKMERQFKRLREINGEKKVKKEMLSQGIGGRKLVMAMLKRLGVVLKDTKLDRMMDDPVQSKHLIEAN